MTLIATCGHTIPSGVTGVDIVRMTQERPDAPSLSYEHVCRACERIARADIAAREVVGDIWMARHQGLSPEEVVLHTADLTQAERLQLAHRLADHNERPAAGRFAAALLSLSDRVLVERLHTLAPRAVRPASVLSDLIPWLFAMLGGRLRQITPRPDGHGHPTIVTAEVFWVTASRFEIWTIEDTTIERALARAVLLLETQDETVAGKRWDV